MGIGASVGLGGVNRAEDTRIVQQRLLASSHPPGPIDGRCGPRTISAIVVFQKHFLRAPDGRVDVAGLSWRRLAPTPPGRRSPASPPGGSEQAPQSAGGGAVDVLLPASGTGYKVYGSRSHQYGTEAMIRRLQRIGVE